MATERKKITMPPSRDIQGSDELNKLLNDGWYVKCWTFDAISNSYQYMLEREVPNHDS